MNAVDSLLGCSFTQKTFEEKKAIVAAGIGVARGGAQGARPPPPIKTPLTTKSYDNIA